MYCDYICQNKKLNPILIMPKVEKVKDSVMELLDKLDRKIRLKSFPNVSLVKGGVVLNVAFATQHFLL